MDMKVVDVAGPTETRKVGYHTSSLFSSILNLIKNLIGASLLAMPYGTALSGVVPSVVICLVIGALSAFTFGLIGVLCAESNSDTYREVCEKYLGKKFGIAVDVILALYTLPTCIGYGVFVCDCMQVMLLDLLPHAEGSFYTSRACIGIAMTLFVFLPICSIRKLQSLTFTSILGLVAILYCFVFVSMDFAEHNNNGAISNHLADNMWWPPSGSLLGLFPTANIYGACFLVQYNSSKFYFELKNPTKRRFLLLSYAATMVVVVFCGAFAIMGFARFGLETPGNLLKSYKSAYAVWVATSLSLIATYPFDFDAGRRSVVSMLTGLRPWLTEDRVFWVTTFTLIPIFSIISVLVDNLSMIVGMNGSLFGNTVGFTLPGLLLWSRSRQQQLLATHAQQTPHRNCMYGQYGGIAIAAFGVFMSVLGFISLFVQFK